jgi:hypothetical protein
MSKIVISEVACTDIRPSIHDDDWFEPKSDKPEMEGGTTVAQRIREWRPQTTVAALPVTQIGFTTTTIGRTTNILGLDRLTTTTSMMTGFITSREALSILPTEPTINNKRKAEQPHPQKSKPRVTKQSTLTSWIQEELREDPLPVVAKFDVKTRSTGVVHDRGKPTEPPRAMLPPDPSSSPARGYDIDALPPVLFSSPSAGKVEEEFESPLAKPGKRFIVEEVPPAPLLPACPMVAGQRVSVAGVVPVRKSLGIRRGMKPWGAK